MMSILIGCVGMLELLACLRHVADGVVIRINQPATPCLSYHEPNDNMSTHDSICSYSHSTDVNLPRGAKHKLENLHEYSLRIRTELRRFDKNFDYSRPLSECSIKDFLLPTRASPDSRLSPDFEYLVQASDSREDAAEASNDYKETRYERETSYEDAAENWRVESSSRDRPLSVMAPPEPERYVRVPTPIPFSVDDQLSSSGASSDVGTSFDNEDSGNEAPTMRSFESIPLIRRYKTPSEEGGSSVDESDDNERHARHPRKPKIGKSQSKSPEGVEVIVDRSRSSENLREIETEIETEKPYRAEKLDASNEVQGGEPSARGTSQRKKIKSSSTIVRKPTRLKSKDAQVSKSAENLTARKSKKHRDPQRRKSDISVQTASSHLRDEWTNTSPPSESPVALSRSESRRSVSVQVQTNFEDLEQLSCLDASTELLDAGSAVGLSESRRDLTSRDRFGRRTFKNRRFGSGSRDKADDGRDDYSISNATTSVERHKDEARLLKISSFEEADDEDYQRIRDILTEPDSRQCNELERRKGSRTASSFEDEEYWDAEDVSGRSRPIRYSIPDPDGNKAFWVMTQPMKLLPDVSLRCTLVRLHLLFDLLLHTSLRQ